MSAAHRTLVDGVIPSSSSVWTTVARAFRRTALPLSAYYAVTLAVPLANGAGRSGAAFAAHALVVLLAPPALIVVLAVAFHTARRSLDGRVGSTG
jgi:hypothetical protein